MKKRMTKKMMMRKRRKKKHSAMEEGEEITIIRVVVVGVLIKIMECALIIITHSDRGSPLQILWNSKDKSMRNRCS